MTTENQSINVKLLENSNETTLNNNSSSSNEFTLLDFLLTIVKHKTKIFGVTFGISFITLVLSLFLSNIYTARTMILPLDDDRGIMAAMMAQMGGLTGLADTFGGKSKADLYVTMLKSDTLKDAIIDRFKLMEVYDAQYRMSAYRELEGNTKIALGKKDGVITISVDDKDPTRAAQIANAYVSELERLTVSLNTASAKNNSSYLEKRIAETRADLSKAEDALKAFQSKNKTISVTEQTKATIEGVAQLRAQLAVQEVQLGTLSRQFTDNSQEVKTVKSAIANMKSQIAELEGRGNGSSSLPNLGVAPDLAQKYVRLMREFKIQEAVLEMLVKQYEMASLSETKDVSPLQVIQVAKTPEVKSRPKRSMIVLLTTFTTAFFMVLLAFICEFRDRMLPEERARWSQIRRLLPDLSGYLIKLRGLVIRGRA